MNNNGVLWITSEWVMYLAACHKVLVHYPVKLLLSGFDWRQVIEIAQNFIIVD